MTTHSPVTVLGATGNIGTALTHQLLAKGYPVVAVARPSARLDALARAGATPAAGSLLDVPFLTEALRPSGAAFLMIPPNATASDVLGDMDRIGAAIATAVQASGIRYALNLSSSAAGYATGTGPTVALHRQEIRLNALPHLTVAHLRPAYFMENLLANIGLLQHQGISGSPLRPDLAMPMVASRDIATRAAALLTGAPLEAGAHHYILGPTDYTLQETAAALAQAIGRPGLPYVQFTYADAKQGMLRSGMSENMADLLLEMNRSLNDGQVTVNEPRTTANTTPTTLTEFADEVFAPIFRSATAG